MVGEGCRLGWVAADPAATSVRGGRSGPGRLTVGCGSWPSLLSRWP